MSQRHHIRFTRRPTICRGSRLGLIKVRLVSPALRCRRVREEFSNCSLRSSEVRRSPRPRWKSQVSELTNVPGWNCVLCEFRHLRPIALISLHFGLTVFPRFSKDRSSGVLLRWTECRLTAGLFIREPAVAPDHGWRTSQRYPRSAAGDSPSRLSRTTAVDRRPCNVVPIKSSC